MLLRNLTDEDGHLGMQWIFSSFRGGRCARKTVGAGGTDAVPCSRRSAAQWLPQRPYSGSDHRKQTPDTGRPAGSGGGYQRDHSGRCVQTRRACIITIPDRCDEDFTGSISRPRQGAWGWVFTCYPIGVYTPLALTVALPLILSFADSG